MDASIEPLPRRENLDVAAARTRCLRYRRRILDISQQVGALHIAPAFSCLETVDTIYHEHLCYFSLTALDRLFRRNGLVIVDVERLEIHGGTLRIIAMRADAPGLAKLDRSSVERLLHHEDERNANRPAFYSRFGEKVERLRDDLVGLLRRLKA